jgi:hypothetical protein
MTFAGTTVGGLSGLDHDPTHDRWFAISDDRSALQSARFYELSMAVSEAGITRLEVTRTATLKDANGLPYPGRSQGPASEVPDPESIRYLSRRNSLLWTSEGDVRLGLPPALREMNLDGRLQREFKLPEMFSVVDPSHAGPRNNLSFEGLAITPDQRHAWVAMEAPLMQDGPLPQPGVAGGPCRITRFDLDSGQADLQIAYQPDPILHSPIPPGGPADNGISEILMINAHEMLVLERSYMMGVGMSLALYRINTRQAQDTLGLGDLRQASDKMAPKNLVADFGQLGISRLDNSEGLSWGPTLANGHRSLVAVSDDNFSMNQITQFLAFEYLL